MKKKINNNITYDKLFNNEKTNWIKIFIICFLFSFITILPTLLTHKGQFYYYGDFIGQQIPFAIQLQQHLKNGGGLWNWYVELGVDIHNSFNFYILFSPFFWILLLFPAKLIPFLIGPIYCIKVGCMGITSYLCFKDLLKNEKYSLMGGVLYALCGWQVVSMFANHFAEPMIIFPLLLLTFNKAYEEKNITPFIVTTAAALIINYFFFMCEALALILYFLCRVIFDKNYRKPFKNFILVGVGALIGVGLSSITLIPTIDYLMNFDRASEFLNKHVFLYENIGYYLEIIKSFFFFPHYNAYNTFYGIEERWSTIVAYIPVVGPLFVFPFFLTKQPKENKWLKYLIIVFFIFAMIPILNASFIMFNAQFYTRWFFIFTFFLILASIKIMQNKSQYIKQLELSNYIIFGISILLYFIGTFFWVEHPENLIGYNILYVIVSMMFILLSFVVNYLYFTKENVKDLNKNAIVLLIFYCFAAGLGVCPFRDHGCTCMNFAKEQKEYVSEFNESNPFERIIYIETNPQNVGMYLNVPSTEVFLSSGSAGTSKFYDKIEYRGVSSYIPSKYNGFQSLLSGKYFIIQEPKLTTKTILGEKTREKNPDEIKEDILKQDTTNYTYKGEIKEKMSLYENNNYIPFGFYFKYYITESEYEKYSIQSQNNIVLEAILIADENEKFISQYLKKWNKQIHLPSYNAPILRTQTVNNLVLSRNSLSCDITVDEPAVLFFSMDNSKYWQFYINEKPIDKTTVFYGLTGLLLEESGEYKITAKYNNTAFNYGLYVSLMFVIITLIISEIEYKKLQKNIFVTNFEDIEKINGKSIM